MPPHPRSTLRRRAPLLNWLVRWGGAVVCVVVVPSWLATIWLSIALVTPWGTASVSSGAIWYGNQRIAYGEYARYLSRDPQPSLEARLDEFENSPFRQPGRYWRVHREVELSALFRDRYSRWQWWPGIDRQSFLLAHVPLWCFVVLPATAAFPSWRRLLRRRRRSRIGRCPICGYDLAGLGGLGAGAATLKCPECGAAVS